jgi:integrase
MSNAALTAKAVDSLRPVPSKQVEHRDGKVRGLYLRVSPGGKKSWILMYRRKGRLRKYTFAPYPDLGLADARRRAREILHDVASGRDPAAERKADRSAETFQQLADLYLQKHAIRKRSASEDGRILKHDLLPHWGSWKAKDVTRRDVRELVATVAQRAPIMANRVLALARKMFNFGISEDLVETNPCHGVAAPAPERQRDRVLTTDEIRRVWTAIGEEKPTAAAILKLRLLTGQRGGEVLTMRWADICFDTNMWTIPAERAKNGRSHRVPLTWQSVEILESLRNSHEDLECLWVFPTPWHGGKRPIGHIQKAIERIRRKTGVEFRGHDLRRTAASLMTGAGIARLTVTKLLNHSEQSVTAIYDRHSYDDEKRRALEIWDRKLASIAAESTDLGRTLRFQATG